MVQGHAPADLGGVHIARDGCEFVARGRRRRGGEEACTIRVKHAVEGDGAELLSREDVPSHAREKYLPSREFRLDRGGAGAAAVDFLDDAVSLEERDSVTGVAACERRGCVARLGTLYGGWAAGRCATNLDFRPYSRACNKRDDDEREQDE